MPTRAESPSVRSRRLAVRAVTQLPSDGAQPSLATRLMLLANTRAARTAFVLVGTAGLAALAIAIVGPRRLEKDVIRPLRGAIEPQAEKLWAESKPVRDQIAQLFHDTAPTGREKLVRSFQSWIGHFRAT